ncbi:MAG: TRAP transporter small permease [Granulosicoccus sp.]
MAPLRATLKIISTINDAVLSLARMLAVAAIAVMVCSILVQVFFRYVINNALPWPDEFARFCMLWMTGLMAPVAYRSGGFVAIDMLPEMLGRRASALLSLFMFLLSLAVLIVGIKLGYKHISSGWLFSSSSLRIPLSLIGMESIKLKLVYMYSSLWIGLILLTAVNVELVLQTIIRLFGGDEASGVNNPPNEATFAGAD